MKERYIDHSVFNQCKENGFSDVLLFSLPCKGTCDCFFTYDEAGRSVWLATCFLILISLKKAETVLSVQQNTRDNIGLMSRY